MGQAAKNNKFGPSKGARYCLNEDNVDTACNANTAPYVYFFL